MPTLKFYDDNGYELPQDLEAGHVVYMEFSSWHVRGLLPADGRLVIRKGDGTEIPLKWNDQLVAWRLPGESKKQERLGKKIRGTAGLLRFYRSSGVPGDEGEELSPSLYISPASLTEEEFRVLLERLGELVVLLDSPVVAPVRGLRPGIGGPADYDVSNSKQPAGEGLLQRAERFIDLCETVQQYWPLIAQRPSRELRRREALVPVGSPYVATDASAVISYALHPGCREVKSVVAVEDLNVADNRFLAYLLRGIILRRVGPLLRALRQRWRWLKQPPSRPRLGDVPSEFRADYRRLWKMTDHWRNEELERLEQVGQRVRKAERWACLHLQSPFLADCKPELPLQPSQRLLQSPDYGPVYAAFIRYRGNGSQQFTKGTDLLRAIEEHTIRPTWDLYEKWVFVEVYWSLVEDFGFRPTVGSLLNDLSTENARLSLSEGKKYELALLLSGEDEDCCRVILSYDNKVQPPPCKPDKNCYDPDVCSHLTCYQHIMGNNGRWSKQLSPDVWLEIVVDENPPLKFAIDAKMRRYAEQSVEQWDKKQFGADIGNVFEVDLLGTAKMKYLNALNVQAAFVVHCDPAPGFTFWGGEWYQRPPHREQALGMRIVWPGHQFGAVFASPTRPGNIRRLLKCILMYHCELYDICWNCRKRMTVENGGARLNWRNKPIGLSEQEGIAALSTGSYRNRGGAIYYQCPDCGAFWIRQCCFGKGHPLIKLGQESFHAHSKEHPGNVWINICPECGSDLPRDYGQPTQ